MVGMKALRSADSAIVSLGLQDEIRRSEEFRYDHRLHGVLLVAQGRWSGQYPARQIAWEVILDRCRSDFSRERSKRSKGEDAW